MVKMNVRDVVAKSEVDDGTTESEHQEREEEVRVPRLAHER